MRWRVAVTTGPEQDDILLRFKWWRIANVLSLNKKTLIMPSKSLFRHTFVVLDNAL